MSGVRDVKQAIWLASATAATNFLFTLMGVWLVERVGRRRLTLGSIFGVCVRPCVFVLNYACRRHISGVYMCPSFDKIRNCIFLAVSLLALYWLNDVYNSPFISLWGQIFWSLPGTALSLIVLAVGFLISAQNSPPVTLHPTELINSTCSHYG